MRSCCHHCDRELQNLTYSVKSIKNKKETLTILKGLDGCFEPAQMSALVRLTPTLFAGMPRLNVRTRAPAILWCAMQHSMQSQNDA